MGAISVAVVGSGDQGTGLAGLLALEPDAERIVLADYDPAVVETAMKLVGELEGVDRRKVELVPVAADRRAARPGITNQSRQLNGYSVW